MSNIQRSFDGESLITPELIAKKSAYRNAPSNADESATAKVHVALLLSVFQQRFEAGHDPAIAVDRLSGELHKMRLVLKPEVWRDLVPIIQHHPIAGLIHQDPFTHWSFRKPRGYSGDAHLLDFIYGHAEVQAEVAEATPLGQALYAHTSTAPASAAVCERRDILARLVDDAAAANPGGTEIFTIAAGHLREADLSGALGQGRIARWVALDQDPESIEAIEARFSGTCVAAVGGSVRGILKGEHDLGAFDVVYAAGLYDYLTHDVALKLTKKCLSMLKPGGTFLFANFSTDIAEDAFMETFMNWQLLLRSERDMWNIIDAIDPATIADTRVFYGNNRNIVYGTIKTPA